MAAQLLLVQLILSDSSVVSWICVCQACLLHCQQTLTAAAVQALCGMFIQVVQP